MKRVELPSWASLKVLDQLERATAAGTRIHTIYGAPGSGDDHADDYSHIGRVDELLGSDVVSPGGSHPDVPVMMLPVLDPELAIGLHVLMVGPPGSPGRRVGSPTRRNVGLICCRCAGGVSFGVTPRNRERPTDDSIELRFDAF